MSKKQPPNSLQTNIKLPWCVHTLSWCLCLEYLVLNSLLHSHIHFGPEAVVAIASKIRVFLQTIYLQYFASRHACCSRHCLLFDVSRKCGSVTGTIVWRFTHARLSPDGPSQHILHASGVYIVYTDKLYVKWTNRFHILSHFTICQMGIVHFWKSNLFHLRCKCEKVVIKHCI